MVDLQIVVNFSVGVAFRFQLDILFRINQGTSLDTLAKHIEQQLKKREFSAVFEDELERCWPRQKLKRAEAERQIQPFAESHGWSASILDSDSGPRAIFREVKWKETFVHRFKASE